MLSAYDLCITISVVTSRVYIFQFHAMCALHDNGYSVSKAIANLVPAGGPVLCRDEMEEWSAGNRDAGSFDTVSVLMLG